MAQDYTHVMTMQQARDQRARIIQETPFHGNKVIVRTRSWSYDGTFAAIEVNGVSLYSAAQVDAFINEHLPDYALILGKRYMGGWQFKLDNEFVKAPDNANYWSEAEIHRVGGLVTVGNSYYRLVRPF